MKKTINCFVYILGINFDVPFVFQRKSQKGGKDYLLICVYFRDENICLFCVPKEVTKMSKIPLILGTFHTVTNVVAGFSHSTKQYLLLFLLANIPGYENFFCTLLII